MAGFPLTLINGSFTGSGSSGAFDLSQFSSVTVFGNISGAGGLALSLEAQGLDGNWYPVAGSPFFTGSGAVFVNGLVTDFNAGRISWSQPNTQTDTIDLSVFGVH